MSTKTEPFLAVAQVRARDLRLRARPVKSVLARAIQTPPARLDTFSMSLKRAIQCGAAPRARSDMA